MFKILYKFFPNQMNEVVYNSQPRPDEFGKMKVSFVCNGKRYYRYRDDLDIPLQRKGQIDILLKEWEAKISSYELQDWLSKMEKSLDEAVSGSAVKSLAKIGFLIEELKARQEKLIHTEILFALVGAMYIREDQDPAVWNEEVERMKIREVKKAYEEGGAVRDFFDRAGWSEFLPFIGKSQINMKQLLDHSRENEEQRARQINKIFGNTELEK